MSFWGRKGSGFNWFLGFEPRLVRLCPLPEFAEGMSRDEQWQTIAYSWSGLDANWDKLCFSEAVVTQLRWNRLFLKQSWCKLRYNCVFLKRSWCKLRYNCVFLKRSLCKLGYNCVFLKRSWCKLRYNCMFLKRSLCKLGYNCVFLKRSRCKLR